MNMKEMIMRTKITTLSTQCPELERNHHPEGAFMMSSLEMGNIADRRIEKLMRINKVIDKINFRFVLKKYESLIKDLIG